MKAMDLCPRCYADPQSTVSYILSHFDKAVSDKAREAAEKDRILIAAVCTNQILKLGVENVED